MKSSRSNVGSVISRISSMAGHCSSHQRSTLSTPIRPLSDQRSPSSQHSSCSMPAADAGSAACGRRCRRRRMVW